MILFNTDDFRGNNEMILSVCTCQCNFRAHNQRKIRPFTRACNLRNRTTNVRGNYLLKSETDVVFKKNNSPGGWGDGGFMF